MEVKLTDIGEGMTEATINCFFVKPGDVVKADQPLLEVQTDKMTAEIPAPSAGKIKELLVGAGETILVGTTLLVLEKTSTPHLDPVISSNQNKQTVLMATKSNSLPNSTSYRVMASPFTRKIARENGVLLESIIGTGPGGRITDNDVYEFIAKQFSLVSKDNSQAEKTRPFDQIGSQDHEIPINDSSDEDVIPFRGRRKQIAKKLVQSVQLIPHCTHFEEIDMSSLTDFRTELKNIGRHISATAFFIKALSICLKEFPIFNASLEEKKELIVLKKQHHIGIAVDTDDGLIVPVIRNVELKSISTIQTEMKDLTEKALQNRLTVKEISGGTFTISNVGPLGGSIGATPIIQHPEVALVSFHKTKKRAVVTENDEIVIRPMMNISMSFDHRVADGATAVAFTNRLTTLLENPKLMVLELV